MILFLFFLFFVDEWEIKKQNKDICRKLALSKIDKRATNKAEKTSSSHKNTKQLKLRSQRLPNRIHHEQATK